MSVSTILAEYHRGRSTAVIERVYKGCFQADYKVTFCRHFISPEKAKAAFLSDLPTASRETYARLIDENDVPPSDKQ